jgi:hypothetical protein
MTPNILPLKTSSHCLGAWKQALAAETWPSNPVSQSDACLARGRRGEKIADPKHKKLGKIWKLGRKANIT